MPTTWTAEQILALAPDAASAKAGQGLATPRKWVTLGRSNEAVWGECQGSGKDPYRTQIDLGEPAFKCSCPSRKFPCKHGLGLFLALATAPQKFTATAPPDWVAAWLGARQQRAQAAAEKPVAANKAPDGAVGSRRLGEREKKVTSGLSELRLWLDDLLRAGLAAAQSQPYAYWEAPAARLVDAQAPGAARLLREMAGLPASGAGWQERLLDRLGRLHLLLEGYGRLAELPAETQADLRSLIGWTQNQEELLAQPGLRDRWWVLGRHVEEEDRLRVQRSWLWGAASGRAALVLQFAHGSQPLDAGLVPGTGVPAELVFFPGSYPLRALVKERGALTDEHCAVPGYAAIEDAVTDYAGVLARLPWLERFPMRLRAVIPARQGEAWAVRDLAGRLLPLSPRFARPWHLLALSGGHAVSLFGEWDGERLLPLSAWSEGRFVDFNRPV